MTSQRNKQILAFIDRLSREIKLARGLSLTHTARLLEITKLDLGTILHSISDEELQVFTHSVDEALADEEESAAKLN